MKCRTLCTVNCGAFVWLWLQTISILLFLLRHQPYSASFIRDKSYYERLNQSDIAEHLQAEWWLENEVKKVEAAPNTSSERSKPAPICLAIPTAPRAHTTYVTKTAKSIFDQISPDEKKLLFSVLFVVHLQDQPHTSAMKLAPLFDLVTQRTSLAANQSSKSDWLANERRDYASVLSLCMEHGSDYALVLEDDVRATKHVVSKLTDVLAHAPSPDWLPMHATPHMPMRVPARKRARPSAFSRADVRMRNGRRGAALHRAAPYGGARSSVARPAAPRSEPSSAHK